MAEAPENYTKTPWEKAPYNMLFPSSVTSITTISTWYVSPVTEPSLYAYTPTTSGGSVQFWIESGYDGTNYVVVAGIVDQDGRQLEGRGNLRVRSD